MKAPPILPAAATRRGQLASLAELATIVEEEVWLVSRSSARTTELELQQEMGTTPQVNSAVENLDHIDLVDIDQKT